MTGLLQALSPQWWKGDNGRGGEISRAHSRVPWKLARGAWEWDPGAGVGQAQGPWMSAPEDGLRLDLKGGALTPLDR